MATAQPTPKLIWGGSIPILEAEEGSTLFFLPIQGKLFGKPVPYVFPQEFLVSQGNLLCAWSGQPQVENLLSRRGHKHPATQNFKLFISVGFGLPNFAAGTSGSPWLEPALIAFAANPVTGDKEVNQWLEVIAKKEGFKFIGLRSPPLDFLYEGMSNQVMGRLNMLSQDFPDFSKLLPYPTRAQVMEIYKLGEKSQQLIPAKLLPHED